jgi:hypothetical protein
MITVDVLSYRSSITSSKSRRSMSVIGLSRNVAGGQLGSHFQRLSGEPVIHPAAAGPGPVA